MGFELPSPTSRAKELIARKQDIESELESQIEILKTNDSTLSSPLLDPNGFPRADIDIWAVRHARVKIIELRNDLKDVMDSIAKALEGIYVPPPPPEEAEVVPEARGDSEPVLTPFAKVNAVAPGSPAASAGLQRDDLIVKFGPLVTSSFTTPSSLQPLADLVAANENHAITIRVVRGAEQTPAYLTFTPKQGWGGRGMLGCHIVPHTST